MLMESVSVPGPGLQSERGGAGRRKGCGAAAGPGRPGRRPSRRAGCRSAVGPRALGVARSCSGEGLPALPSRGERGESPGLKPTGSLLCGRSTSPLGMRHAAPVFNINLTCAVTILFMVLLM